MTAVKICPLEPAQYGAAFDLVTDVFVASGTLHRALDIGLEEYRAHLAPGFDRVVRQGHSSVAVDEATGDILGALIAMDYANLWRKGPLDPEPFAAISALGAELRASYPKPAPGSALLVDMAAVTTGASGRGLYRAMRADAQDRARGQGFQKVVGELSSARTQRHLVGSLGHKVLGQVWFDRFVHDGRRPFAAITEPPSLQLVEFNLVR